jgi:hypothetical protein
MALIIFVFFILYVFICIPLAIFLISLNFIISSPLSSSVLHSQASELARPRNPRNITTIEPTNNLNGSEAQIPGGSRERDYVPDVGKTGYKLDQALKSETKTGVGD